MTFLMKYILLCDVKGRTCLASCISSAEGVVVPATTFIHPVSKPLGGYGDAGAQRHRHGNTLEKMASSSQAHTCQAEKIL